MRRDILISAIAAIGIHAIVFSAPLPRVGNNSRCHIDEPISITVTYPGKTVATSSTMETKDTEPVEPPKKRIMTIPATRNKVIEEPKSVETREVEPEPTQENKLEADRETPVADILKMPEEENRDAAVKTASVNRHTPENEQRAGEAFSEDETAHDYIVYAKPRYKTNPPPHYPEIGRRRGYEGRTLLKVEVLKNGRAGRIEIEESSGYKVLDTAALKSVKAWTFVPGIVNGLKATQWIRVPIRFALKQPG
jgi:protein TonB